MHTDVGDGDDDARRSKETSPNASTVTPTTTQLGKAPRSNERGAVGMYKANGGIRRVKRRKRRAWYWPLYTDSADTHPEATPRTASCRLCSRRFTMAGNSRAHLARHARRRHFVETAPDVVELLRSRRRGSGGGCGGDVEEGVATSGLDVLQRAKVTILSTPSRPLKPSATASSSPTPTHVCTTAATALSTSTGALQTTTATVTDANPTSVSQALASYVPPGPEPVVQRAPLVSCDADVRVTSGGGGGGGGGGVESNKTVRDMNGVPLFGSLSHARGSLEEDDDAEDEEDAKGDVSVGANEMNTTTMPSCATTPTPSSSSLAPTYLPHSSASGGGSGGGGGGSSGGDGGGLVIQSRPHHVASATTTNTTTATTTVSTSTIATPMSTTTTTTTTTTPTPAPAPAMPATTPLPTTATSTAATPSTSSTPTPPSAPTPTPTTPRSAFPPSIRQPMFHPMVPRVPGSHVSLRGPSSSAGVPLLASGPHMLASVARPALTAADAATDTEASNSSGRDGGDGAGAPDGSDMDLRDDASVAAPRGAQTVGHTTTSAPLPMRATGAHVLPTLQACALLDREGPLGRLGADVLATVRQQWYPRLRQRLGTSLGRALPPHHPFACYSLTVSWRAVATTGQRLCSVCLHHLQDGRDLGATAPLQPSGVGGGGGGGVGGVPSPPVQPLTIVGLSVVSDSGGGGGCGSSSRGSSSAAPALYPLPAHRPRAPVLRLTACTLFTVPVGPGRAWSGSAGTRVDDADDAVVDHVGHVVRAMRASLHGLGLQAERCLAIVCNTPHRSTLPVHLAKAWARHGGAVDAVVSPIAWMDAVVSGAMWHDSPRVTRLCHGLRAFGEAVAPLGAPLPPCSAPRCATPLGKLCLAWSATALQQPTRTWACALRVMQWLLARQSWLKQVVAATGAGPAGTRDARGARLRRLYHEHVAWPLMARLCTTLAPLARLCGCGVALTPSLPAAPALEASTCLSEAMLRLWARAAALCCTGPAEAGDDAWWLALVTRLAHVLDTQVTELHVAAMVLHPQWPAWSRTLVGRYREWSACHAGASEHGGGTAATTSGGGGGDEEGGDACRGEGEVVRSCAHRLWHVVLRPVDGKEAQERSLSSGSSRSSEGRWRVPRVLFALDRRWYTGAAGAGARMWRGQGHGGAAVGEGEDWAFFADEWKRWKGDVCALYRWGGGSGGDSSGEGGLSSRKGSGDERDAADDCCRCSSGIAGTPVDAAMDAGGEGGGGGDSWPSSLQYWSDAYAYPQLRRLALRLNCIATGALPGHHPWSRCVDPSLGAPCLEPAGASAAAVSHMAAARMGVVDVWRRVVGVGGSRSGEEGGGGGFVSHAAEDAPLGVDALEGNGAYGPGGGGGADRGIPVAVDAEDPLSK